MIKGVKEQTVSSGSADIFAPGLFRDLDELNHGISGADLEIIQLDPGDLEVHLVNFDVGEMSIDRGSVNRNLRVKGSLDADRYAVGLFHPGARAKLNGNSVHTSNLLFYNPDLELDGHLQEGYSWTSLIIPATWIESMSQAAKKLSFLTSNAGCKNLLPDPDNFQDLWSATDAILASLLQPELSEQGALILSLDVRNALGAVLGDFDTPTRKTVSRTMSHYRAAQRAERYMRERVSENLSIDEICAELGFSRRYLEYAFVDAFGTSPSRYFRVLRLHQVRRGLRNPVSGTSVTSEALRHGFNHLGLFSTQYRALFGESPSSTLRGQVSPTPSVRNTDSGPVAACSIM